MPRGIPKNGKSKAIALNPVAPKPRKNAPGAGRPKIYTDEWIDNEADILLEWIKKDEGVYIGSFAYERGYSRQNLSEFAQKSHKFSDALEKARVWQEQKFVTNGLTKQWDATQVRYTMARVCGDIWKASYDREDAEKDITLNINVNRLQD